MIQNYRLLKESATKFLEIKEECGGFAPQIQKIYSTAHFIVLAVRFQGRTEYLYIGRGGGFQGLWWHDKLPDPQFRIQKDRLLETYRKYLRGHKIETIEIPTSDRLFIIKCFSKTYYCNLYWFIKGSQGYVSLEFETDNRPLYLHLWEGKIKPREPLLDNFIGEFEPLGLKIEDQVQENKKEQSYSIEKYFSFLDSQKDDKVLLPKSHKKLNKKIENIKRDIIKLENGISIESELNKEDFEIPEGRKVVIKGMKFSFDKSDSFYKKRDLIFQKLKRLKTAIKLQYERLAQVELLKKGKKIDLVSIKPLQPIWFHRQERKKVEDKSKQNNLNADFYKTKDGLIIGVGKDSRGNDQLRSMWGKKEDMWFHVEGHKGSHLIAKGDVKPEHFSLFGAILRDYSKLDINDVPLIYAKLGKVKGLKGQRGAVTIKNPKHIQIVYFSNWKEIISVHL